MSIKRQKVVHRARKNINTQKNKRKKKRIMNFTNTDSKPTWKYHEDLIKTFMN